MAEVKVTVEDMCNIGLAMDELDGAIKDAVKDAPARIKKEVTDIVEFIYKDVTTRVNQYV